MVVAHPDRVSLALELSERINAEAVVWDEDSQGAEFNHRQALAWLGETNPTWSVVLEDDAVPTSAFRDQLTKALALAPTPLVSLYMGRGRPWQWQGPFSKAVGVAVSSPTRIVSWLVATDLVHGVGYALHTNLIPDLLTHLVVSELQIDQAISEWSRLRGHGVAYTFPSLVDHRYDIPSLIDNHHDGEGRIANPTGDHRQELRKAWVCGEKDDWTAHFVRVPTPEEYYGALGIALR